MLIQNHYLDGGSGNHGVGDDAQCDQQTSGGHRFAVLAATDRRGHLRILRSRG